MIHIGRLKQPLRSFLLLSLFTALGIFLHELSHHLVGIPSEVSLARNYPLVPVTAENRNAEVAGTLAGPAVNLLLGYAGLLACRLSKGAGALRSAGLFGGLANAFLTLFASALNLIADLVSGTAGNDLQHVSRLLGLHVLILPAIYIALSMPPLVLLWPQRSSIAQTRATLVLLLVGSFFAGGLLLMSLDAVFQIRFRIL